MQKLPWTIFLDPPLLLYSIQMLGGLKYNSMTQRREALILTVHGWLEINKKNNFYLFPVDLRRNSSHKCPSVKFSCYSLMMLVFLHKDLRNLMKPFIQLTQAHFNNLKNTLLYIVHTYMNCPLNLELIEFLLNKQQSVGLGLLLLFIINTLVKPVAFPERSFLIDRQQEQNLGSRHRPALLVRILSDSCEMTPLLITTGRKQ